MSTDDTEPSLPGGIVRRDFLNGVGIAIGASLTGAGMSARLLAGEATMAEYPPARTGLRGSHPGSFEVAHALVRGRRWSPKPSDESYDLVVVGAGISGLSAAYFYRRDVNPNARILILDNHDDFGGHAKRNEFTLEGADIDRLWRDNADRIPARLPAGFARVDSGVGHHTSLRRNVQPLRYASRTWPRRFPFSG